MNDVIFDFGFFLMEFTPEIGTLAGATFGYSELIGRIPNKETIILS